MHLLFLCYLVSGWPAGLVGEVTKLDSISQPQFNCSMGTSREEMEACGASNNPSNLISTSMESPNTQFLVITGIGNHIWLPGSMERVKEMTSLFPSCQLLSVSLSLHADLCAEPVVTAMNQQKPQLPVLWILATCIFQLIDATKVMEEKDLIPQGSCRRGTRFLKIWLAKYQHTFFFIPFYLLSSWQLHIMFCTCFNNQVMVLSSIISDPPSLKIMTTTQTLFDIDYIKIQSKKVAGIICTYKRRAE